MFREERGLTLIELLLAISILSIIGLIIWNVFFQGYQFSQKSTSKNLMIQESNLLITNIKNIHQSADSYSISSSSLNPCAILVSVDGNPPIEYSHPRICYEFRIIEISTKNPTDTIDPNNIEPTKNNVHLEIITSDHKDRNNKVTVDTLLYRLKEGPI